MQNVFSSMYKKTVKYVTEIEKDKKKKTTKTITCEIFELRLR